RGAGRARRSGAPPAQRRPSRHSGRDANAPEMAGSRLVQRTRGLARPAARTSRSPRGRGPGRRRCRRRARGRNVGLYVSYPTATEVTRRSLSLPFPPHYRLESLLRCRAGQNDASDEPGTGILQRQRAAVQMADCRHNGQPEAIAGKAPAAIETIEPRHHLRSFFDWDARAFVPDQDRDAFAVLSRPDAHGGLGPTTILQRVVDEIRRRAREKILVTERRGLADDVDRESHAARFGGGVVQLDDVLDDVLQRDLLEALAACRRFGLRDLEKLVENDDELVDAENARCRRVTELLARDAGPKHLVEAVSNPAQRRSKVVRDRIRHVAHALHQALDAIEHAVDITIQPREFVVGIRHRDATAQISGLDLERRVA